MFYFFHRVYNNDAYHYKNKHGNCQHSRKNIRRNLYCVGDYADRLGIFDDGFNPVPPDKQAVCVYTVGCAGYESAEIFADSIRREERSVGSTIRIWCF